MSSADEILAQIDLAVADREVGPDAVRCNPAPQASAGSGGQLPIRHVTDRHGLESGALEPGAPQRYILGAAGGQVFTAYRQFEADAAYVGGILPQPTEES